MSSDSYVVRLYDGFDDEWIDVSDVVSEMDARKIYNEKTLNGTKATSYHDIDYYRIVKLRGVSDGS